ncbi:MAG TPA: GNAT family N-acetyltransferase [Alphaproteobacteria bacterium]|nr:GNAT family N-acetyltransferase [Alphaproteobacteria bacterium]
MSDLALDRPALRTAGPAAAVTLARDAAALAALRPHWEALAERCGAGPFQLPVWVESWWRHIGEAGGFRLAVAAAWRDGRLVGLLPLAIRRRRWGRQLEWAATDVLDYPDALIDPGEATLPLLDRMWADLRRAGGWDVARLADLRPAAACRPWIAARLRFCARTEPAYCIDLPAPGEGGWLRRQGGQYRRNVPRAERRLAELGPVALDRAATPAEIRDATAALAAQKQRWMAATGHSGAVAAPGMADFLAEVAGVLAARDLLELHALRCGERVAGIVMALRIGRSLGIFLPAYDIDLANAAPGKVMLTRLIEGAVARGYRQVDFLRGGESYKQETADRQVPLACAVAGRGPLGHLLAAAIRFAATPRGEALKAALRRRAEGRLP